MKIIIISLTVLSMLFYGCKNTAKTDSHDHSGETAEAHAGHEKEKAHKHEEGEHKHEAAGEHKHEECSGHSHEAEEHEGHDHEAEGHEGHNHEAEGHEGHSHEAKTANKEQEHSDEIIFTKAQADKTEFEVKEIQPKSFNRIIKTTGQVMPALGDESIIVAANSGIISFANTQLTEGAAVKQGQTLFYVVSKNLSEGDYYSKINATYEKTKAEYERAQKLIKDKIISQKELEAIRLDYQNAKIAYNAVSGKQSDRGVSVPAPIGGFIKNFQVKDGEYVTAGQTLGAVSQNKRLVLRAEVCEKEYPLLKTISSANFKTPYDNNVYALSDLQGRLLSVGKTAGENTFYIPVTFEFDNRGDVIPGSFVEIYLISSPLENAITVPVSALTNEMGISYVYIQLDEEGYRKQEVKTGTKDGKEVLILKGVNAGDRVVTQGAYQVKMASASGAIPHGHEH